MRDKKWLQNRIAQLKRDLADLKGDSQFCVEQRYVLTTDIERLQDELDIVKRESKMSNDEKRQARGSLIFKYPEKSDRELAKIVGCSAMTINRHRKWLESNGWYERPKTIIDSTGKKQPIKRRVSVKHISSKTKERTMENLKEGNFDTERKDLLPCPFCGGKAKCTFDNNGFLIVECEKCGAYGPDGDTNRECLEVWNKRVTCVRYIYSDDVAGKFVTNDTVIRDNPVVKDSFTAPEAEKPNEQEWNCCRLERQNGELVCTAEDTDKRRCGNCELRLETGSEQCRCPLMWNTSSMQKRIVDECDELRHVLIDKNQNYGDSALTAPPFANVSIQDALLIRLGDKFKRLESLTHGDDDRVGEPLADTIQDISGYCILLLVEMKKGGCNVQ